ncbi:MAG TPA: hypothetical protein VFW05_18120 [Verrucomicrobiae bacterium]|nr:hypothetical protein [Verrucomicrobiae bacterium]
MAEQLEGSSKAASKQAKAEKRELKSELATMPRAALRDYFTDDPNQLTKREIRGLTEVARLAQTLLENPEPETNSHWLALREILAGLRNNRRSPVPQTAGIFSPWQLLIQNWDRSISGGSTEAADLGRVDQPEHGMIDPQPSGFWQRPTNLPAQNLYFGFGRTHLPSFSEIIWDYHGPKTSSGTRPGFEVRDNGVDYKIKLAEVSSEPFTARIFDALGYHVDPTDFAPEIKVRYSRRFFREFNMRQSLRMRLRPLGIPIGSMELQPHYDPFQFVNRAVFKDGRAISGTELKRELLINSRRSHPEEFADNFRTEVESQLDYIVVGPANVQLEDEPIDSIGMWDFGGLGHEDRRELRGVGLLAAWVGWFDSRFDNTRLRSTRNGDNLELLYFFTDLGSGMGGGNGWFRRHGENPNAFEWTFTSPEIIRGPGRMTTPFRIEHFRTIVPTPAFQRMTVNDARWMARLIAQLSESQIAAALIGSGYDSAEARLYLEKLLNRRDQMLRDLGLEKEIPPLRKAGADRHLNYDPTPANSFHARLPSGRIVTARGTSSVIRDGKLIRKP